MGNFKTSVSARLHRFKKFIYDGETGEILGRNLLSWGEKCMIEQLHLIRHANQNTSRYHNYRCFATSYSRTYRSTGFILCCFLHLCGQLFCSPVGYFCCHYPLSQPRNSTMEFWWLCIPKLSKFQARYVITHCLNYSIYIYIYLIQHKQSCIFLFTNRAYQCTWWFEVQWKPLHLLQ